MKRDSYLVVDQSVHSVNYSFALPAGHPLDSFGSKVVVYIEMVEFSEYENKTRVGLDAVATGDLAPVFSR